MKSPATAEFVLLVDGWRKSTSGYPTEAVGLRRMSRPDCGTGCFTGVPRSRQKHGEPATWARLHLLIALRTLVRAPRRVGALALDPHRQEVHFADRHVDLARYEYLLLSHLAADPERVFTKRELCARLWGDRNERATKTLDAHACRLPKKLRQAGAKGYVVNLRGVGYRLVDRIPATDDQGARNGKPETIGLPDRARGEATCGGVALGCAARNG